jgi:two-component system phosphate regulon sensor histidine kinase PhoR
VQGLAVKVAAEVDTLQQMAQEMLDLAAIESGRQVVRLVPESLMQIVLKPLGQMADQARRQQIRLSNEVPEDLMVLADREQVARAVGNILHNALKFTPAGGEVSLAAHHDQAQNRIVLSISDSGPGIPPDELERIFERFFRSDRARGTPGTGLGLSIARHILRAHGGEVWAENRMPPQGGAVFHLALQPA